MLFCSLPNVTVASRARFPRVRTDCRRLQGWCLCGRRGWLSSTGEPSLGLFPAQEGRDHCVPKPISVLGQRESLRIPPQDRKAIRGPLSCRPGTLDVSGQAGWGLPSLCWWWAYPASARDSCKHLEDGGASTASCVSGVGHAEQQGRPLARRSWAEGEVDGEFTAPFSFLFLRTA